MQQQTFTAILLRASDYHESDKLVKLLTLENGKINAVLRGVKKATAKLKFAAQPFAFCSYDLVEGKGGYYTVTGANSLGDLYCLALGENYTLASLLLEAADIVTFTQNSSGIFILLLECLKSLAYSDANSRLVAAQFLLKAIDLAGYKSQYIYSGTNSPTCLLDLCAALQNLQVDKIGSLSVGDSLVKKVLKMQIARFVNKFETPLKTARFID